MGMDDVVNFYNRFQELSMSHLLALMPFDAIILKQGFKRLLCILGLGVQCYAEMGKTLMDFLPRLILGSLSPQFHATLASVRYKSNNGYNYLWRILELTVLGFDPVIPIISPSWGDWADIVDFAQVYLLYFCLQAKMNFHYDDRTRSGIFLQAIQQSDYADTVAPLQLHINLYREQ
jgi:hypothetical protein